jgi:hypothetical protein
LHAEARTEFSRASAMSLYTDIRFRRNDSTASQLESAMGLSHFDPPPLCLLGQHPNQERWETCSAKLEVGTLEVETAQSFASG